MLVALKIWLTVSISNTAEMPVNEPPIGAAMGLKSAIKNSGSTGMNAQHAIERAEIKQCGSDQHGTDNNGDERGCRTCKYRET